MLASIVSCQQPELFYLQDGIVKLKEDASVGSVGKLNGISYKVVDNDMLKEWVMNNAQGRDKHLNVCTSKITNMSGMFQEALFDENGDRIMDIPFNGDISNWDVSNVTDMSDMFNGASSFNQDIGNWDVSNVTDMSGMFNGAYVFNQDIGNWDVSNVTNMSGIFSYANLEQLIQVDETGERIASAFNQDIGNWDVSNVTDMGRMFSGTSFNQPIGDWDVSSVTVMRFMFSGASSFNKDLSSWSVDGVIDCYNFSNGATSWTLPQPNFTNCTP